MKLPVADYSRQVEDLGERSNRYGDELLDFRVREGRKALGYQIDAIKQTERALVNHTEKMTQIEINRLNFELDQKNRDRQAKLTIAKEVLNLAGQGVQAYSQYKAKKAQQSVADSELVRKGLDIKDVEKYGLKPELYADELPEGFYEGETTRTLPDGTTERVKISRDEIWPDLQKHLRTANARSAAEGITDPKMREEFIKEAEIAISTDWVIAKNKQAEEGEKQMAANASATITGLIKSGRFDDADKYNSSLPIPEDKRIENNFLIAKGREDHRINQAHMSGDERAKREAKAYLDDPDYKGPLNSDERRIHSNKFGTDIASIETNRKALRDEVNKQATQSVKDTTELVWSGKITNPALIIQMRDKAAASGASPEVLKDFDVAIETQAFMHEFHQMPKHMRDEKVLMAYDRAQATNEPEHWKFAEMLEKTNNTYETELNKDPKMALAIRGFINPVQIDLSNMDDVTDPMLVGDVITQNNAASRRYGVEVPPLTKNQAVQLGDILETKMEDPKGFTDTLINLERAWGKEYPALMAQVGIENAGVKSLAHLSPASQKQTMLGRQVLVARPGLVPDNKKLEEQVYETFGNTYANDPDGGEAAYQDVRARMAYMMNEKGIVEYNDKIVKNAVSGLPILELSFDTSTIYDGDKGRQSVLAPDDKTTGEDFVRKVKNFPLGAFSGIPPTTRDKGITPEQHHKQMLDAVDDGILVFESTGVRGVYHLRNTLTDTLVRNIDKSPWTFNFHKDEWVDFSTVPGYAFGDTGQNVTQRRSLDNEINTGRINPMSFDAYNEETEIDNRTNAEPVSKPVVEQTEQPKKTSRTGRNKSRRDE